MRRRSVRLGAYALALTLAAGVIPAAGPEMPEVRAAENGNAFLGAVCLFMSIPVTILVSNFDTDLFFKMSKKHIISILRHNSFHVGIPIFPSSILRFKWSQRCNS